MRVIPALVVLAACTSSDPGAGGDTRSANPATLWFAQNAAKTAMVLTGVEPHPF
jgi:hypothetical protein